MFTGGGDSRSFTAWISHLLACMGGCFGCCNKSTPITAVDEPSKGLKIGGRRVRKSSFSDDLLLSTSTCEMDNNSAVHSQRSVSSFSNSTGLPPDSHSAASSEFLNHGLVLWSQARRHWIGTKSLEKKSSQTLREPGLSWNATYDGLLGSSKPFPRPVPLSEMVDFLVDIWEQEGLYD